MTISADNNPPWPSDRGSESGILLQFGGARTDLLRWALTTGDPLADAAIAETLENKEAHKALSQGVRQGLKSLDNPPPAVAAFLNQVETLPDYITDEVIDSDSEPFFSMIDAVHLVSLSAGALIRVYESPSIAKVLTTTGRLVEGADRRIVETGKWLVTAMIPGNMRPGMPGFVATVQVRLLHARMRVLARKRGFDEARYGAPINQVDLVRTWIDFTRTSLLAEREMGFALDSRETARIYRYWWLMAHVLGIDARLVHGISNNEQAGRLDELVQAVTGPLNEESAELARHTLDSIAGQLREALRLPESIGSRALAVLARRFHGDDVADEMRIPANPAIDALLGAAIKKARARRLKDRASPEKWEGTIRANIGTISGRMKSDVGQAQYETASA